MASRSPCPSSRTQTAHGQAYYYGIFACALLAICSIALSVNFLGACCGHYKYESKLTAPQRTLMIQVIVLTAYYLLGALVFSHIESWSFLDAFYWVDLTLLTIGLGHIFTPQTTLGRGLLLPFVIFGISFVGLVIGSIRTLAFKRARDRFQPTLVRTRLKKLAKALRNRKNIIRIGPFHYLDLQKSHLDSCARGERDFSIMRRLLDATKFESRCLGLTLSVVVFVAWWLAGAAVFMASEGWDYFEGWYFSYITFMTIPLTGVRQHLRTEPHTAPAQPEVHGSDFNRQRNRPR